ncbi:MAG: hypothetical protein M5U08_07425 [Burkholderiales bacterium]|nr:hypothetical protein [Burkholderiales bacterium]
MLGHRRKKEERHEAIDPGARAARRGERRIRAADAPEFAQRLGQSYRESFALYDANRDGVLTREEARGSNLLLAQFHEMDLDRSSAVTRAELERFLEAMPPSAR